MVGQSSWWQVQAAEMERGARLLLLLFSYRRLAALAPL